MTGARVENVGDHPPFRRQHHVNVGAAVGPTNERDHLGDARVEAQRAQRRQRPRRRRAPVAVAVGVSSDLTDKISAVDIVQTAVPELGGKGGGGRPDLAQGGGTDISGADAAIIAAKKLL